MGKKSKAPRREEEDDNGEDDFDVEAEEALMKAPKMNLDKSKKRRRQDEEEDEVDAELEAEMAALQAIRQEKQAQAGSTSQKPSQPALYNKEGLQKCLQDWETKDLPFLESMQVDQFELHVENELDDIEREISFFNHTMLAVTEGRARLTALGVPHLKPNDFFCEHVKSDAHMARIKDRLLIEEKKMAAFEQRKQREEHRKYHKQVAATKKAEKKQGEKDGVQQIEKVVKEKATGKDRGDTDEKLEKLLSSQPGKSKKRKIM
eukprot:gene41011-50026_t